MNRVMRTSASLAVGVAEVDAGLIALGFGQFAFLLLVFGKFLVGVGERVARSEHGVGLGGLFFLLAHGAEFVANLAEGRFNGFHFDEKVARTGCRPIPGRGRVRGRGHHLRERRWQARAA